jgi:hypothetical protein
MANKETTTNAMTVSSMNGITNFPSFLVHGQLRVQLNYTSWVSTAQISSDNLTCFRTTSSGGKSWSTGPSDANLSPLAFISCIAFFSRWRTAPGAHVSGRLVDLGLLLFVQDYPFVCSWSWISSRKSRVASAFESFLGAFLPAASPSLPPVEMRD